MTTSTQCFYSILATFSEQTVIITIGLWGPSQLPIVEPRLLPVLSGLLIVSAENWKNPKHSAAAQWTQCAWTAQWRAATMWCAYATAEHSCKWHQHPHSHLDVETASNGKEYYECLFKWINLPNLHFNKNHFRSDEAVATAPPSSLEQENFPLNLLPPADQKEKYWVTNESSIRSDANNKWKHVNIAPMSARQHRK